MIRFSQRPTAGHRGQPSPPKVAFTLIEPLIVIVIIANPGGQADAGAVQGQTKGAAGQLSLPPVPLQADHRGGSLAMSWNGASFILQSSTILAAPYADVPGDFSPLSTNTAASNQPFQFFRLNRAQ